MPNYLVISKASTSEDEDPSLAMYGPFRSFDLAVEYAAKVGRAAGLTPSNADAPTYWTGGSEIEDESLGWTIQTFVHVYVQCLDAPRVRPAAARLREHMTEGASQ